MGRNGLERRKWCDEERENEEREGGGGRTKIIREKRGERWSPLTPLGLLLPPPDAYMSAPKAEAVFFGEWITVGQ